MVNTNTRFWTRKQCFIAGIGKNGQVSTTDTAKPMNPEPCRLHPYSTLIDPLKENPLKGTLLTLGSSSK